MLDFKPEQKPTISEALQTAREKGREMKTAGIDRTKALFNKVWQDAKKIGSAMRTVGEVSLGLTSRETRVVLREAISAELEKAQDAVIDKMFSLGEDFYIKKRAVVEGAKEKFRAFDQEHLVPLNNNLEDIFKIVQTTVRELPGFAAEKAEEQLDKYAAMSRDWVDDQTEKARRVVENAVGVLDIAATTAIELPGFAVQDIQSSVKNLSEQTIAGLQEFLAERKEREAVKAYEQYVEAWEKVVDLRSRAEGHKKQAVRADGGLFGAGTQLRQQAVSLETAGD
ncbi:MAG: hypothetical protein AB1721_02025 [Patescibacteria group bacterium]